MKRLLVEGNRFSILQQLFLGESQVIEGDGVIRFRLEGELVVLGGPGVILLCGQSKAERVFDQRTGFIRLTTQAFQCLLQGGSRLRVQPLAQLNGSELVEVRRLA